MLKDSKATFNNDEYIKVSGTISGEFKGENSFGGDVKSLQIEAKNVKKISAIEAFPAEKTVKVNQTVEKGGCSATIEKADYTKDETRIYISLKNSNSSDFTVYPDQGAIIQDGNQLEANYNDYDKNSSLEINSGATTSGIITFKRIDYKKSFSYSFKGYDSEFNELEFKFEIENN